MFTTSAKNCVMNTIFRASTGVLPTSFAVGISTTAPSVDGTNITEPDSSTGYARATGVAFSAAANGQVANETVISFPTFVANAGVATHYVLYDQNNSPFWFDEFQEAKHMETGDILAFKVGDLQIELKDAE